jgi:hypothetical protein
MYSHLSTRQTPKTDEHRQKVFGEAVWYLNVHHLEWSYRLTWSWILMVQFPTIKCPVCPWLSVSVSSPVTWEVAQLSVRAAWNQVLFLMYLHTRFVPEGI